MIDMLDALLLSERLLAVAIFFQTLEFLLIQKSWSEQGIWRWSTLRQDHISFPKSVLWFFDLTLSSKGFLVLLLLRLAACISVWTLPPHPVVIGILFFSTWLISIRWRGTFNGGSDSMTAIVTLSLWIGRSFSDTPWIVRASLGYIAVQLTASYLIAGWVKLKNPLWRNGTALPVFFNTPGYDSPPEWLRKLLDRPTMTTLAAWSIILFECAFPLAWLSPETCIGILGIAFVFHLMNFWIFGLNRFVFAWLAAYPALYFWSQRH
jgi:hypothetical protein